MLLHTYNPYWFRGETPPVHALPLPTGMRYAALALGLALLAASCAAQRIGEKDKPAAWDATTRSRAQRLALYGRALRCKWPRVVTWSCIDCSAVAGTTILAHWLSEGYAPDDAPDAFTIHNDTVLRALVVTFRSTYTNTAGWCATAAGAACAAAAGEACSMRCGTRLPWPTYLQPVWYRLLYLAAPAQPLTQPLPHHPQVEQPGRRWCVPQSERP